MLIRTMENISTTEEDGGDQDGFRVTQMLEEFL